MSFDINAQGNIKSRWLTQSRDRDLTCSTSAQHCVKTKDVKNGSYCCYVRCGTLIENELAHNRRNSLPCTVKTSRNQEKGRAIK